MQHTGDGCLIYSVCVCLIQFQQLYLQLKEAKVVQMCYPLGGGEGGGGVPPDKGEVSQVNISGQATSHSHIHTFTP